VTTISQTLARRRQRATTLMLSFLNLDETTAAARLGMAAQKP
jgi:hypothetical protein